ncbi:DUF1365 domain-containing protein [Massilia sp. DWR3-1-1]|uniref:DUF1365 domain-containing protein n=1 Tax=Massilia sp. DWR3-1-1 TaxID=2804559 RepID=UPI003CEAD610
MRSPEPAAVPQLCFGRVGHRRLRPVVNAFSYRAYYLRLPLRALGQAQLKSRLFSRNRFNVLSFYDADHGDGASTLLDWIGTLLRAEGIEDADGEVWLQTMPRVLGYVFNPVSFWFCHRADGALRAVLCDVRNTFGERHCYLLDDGAVIADGAELHARKVFHVSPFNPVAGEYRFRFVRTALATGAGERTGASIDYGDADGTLLHTSIGGLSRPLNDRSVALAFFAYPMQSLGVMLRIHYQALRLFLKRAPFYPKPAPPQHKVTR